VFPKKKKGLNNFENEGQNLEQNGRGSRVGITPTGMVKKKCTPIKRVQGAVGAPGEERKMDGEHLTRIR